MKISDYIDQLSSCKDFGHKFQVNGVFWTEIKEIVEALKSSYNLTVDMQRVGFGLSDLYIGWLRVEKNLQRVIAGKPMFDLAANLLKHMKKRAPSLF